MNYEVTFSTDSSVPLTEEQIQQYICEGSCAAGNPVNVTCLAFAAPPKEGE